MEKRNSIGKCWLKITAYAQFLKQPLKLEMFIPCDYEGNVLEKPKSALTYKLQTGECSADEMRLNREYNEALSKVLFKGFEFTSSDYGFRFFNKTSILDDMWSLNYSNKRGFLYNTRTIEDLTHLDLELTETAINNLNQ